jgi:acyl-CoA reductase-like NAD-dependent aldehyde dehydrogenase
VLEYINEAEANGCSILLDGRSWSSEHTAGFWVGPTIILHSNVEDRAMKEEIFGPVLSIYVASSWDEAISIENNNPYGNAACIYTEKGANAEWFIKKFRAAMLGINVGIPVPREPFSFGGLYGTLSKYGNCDITGDGAMEFFSNRIKVTSKWSASYSAASNSSAKKQKTAVYEDKASFDGKM